MFDLGQIVPPQPNLPTTAAPRPPLSFKRRASPRRPDLPQAGTTSNRWRRQLLVLRTMT
jgi:hypothetical protein